MKPAPRRSELDAATNDVISQSEKLTARIRHSANNLLLATDLLTELLAEDGGDDDRPA